jgi:N-formylglutamate amidohydrolase
MTPDLGPPIDLLQPKAGWAPLVISSPHSGQIYPPSLLSELRLDLRDLRCLEDGWVDRLFGCGPELGVPLLRARFARAYVDPNREAFELDPELFQGPLPDHVNAGSLKARAGLGTIPSRIGGRAIYRGRLELSEAERRIRLAYWPYHQALQDLLAKARSQFGAVLLLDCHSMPSLTGNGSSGAGPMIDVALGDRFGRSCAPRLVERAEMLLRQRGLAVARNRPYAGGYITARYGRPEAEAHALQIEIRRSLFMDERTGRPNAALAELEDIVRAMIAGLAGTMVEEILAKARAAE